MLRSPVNLIRNPDFAHGGDLPDAWTGSGNSEQVTFGTSSPGLFGERHATFSVASNAPPAWRGWRQSVPVAAGRSYLYGAWLACENLSGTASLHAHLRDRSNRTGAAGYLSAGPAISGTSSWRPMFAMFTAAPDIAELQMHLTMDSQGTLKHDGTFLAECLEAYVGEPTTTPMKADTLDIWQVDPVVKVFHETPAPEGRSALRAVIALARNEEEPLQLAVRAGRDIPSLRVEVEAPGNACGQTLDDFSVGRVGYVPVDHRTAYYNTRAPAWELKFPAGSGSSDGWPGWWPDPIIPSSGGSLTANRTQAFWLSFRAGLRTPPGVYKGTVKLISGKRVLKRFPFNVTVWDFNLPEKPACAAIYDVRLTPHWLADGRGYAEQYDRIAKFMAGKKVSPDRFRAEMAFKRGADGKVTCDFTDHDRAAGDSVWFTTDGQMCTDTPYCAVERLLPHYCFKYGAEAYEFWGVSWFTYDPWRFGWHSYIRQSSTPGESYHVRYPNGDGYLLYPGLPVGVDGPVTSVRLEAARDGVEDHAYLTLLKSHAESGADPEAAALLREFAALLDIPNAGGRYSTKILPDPSRLAALRLRAGAALQKRARVMSKVPQ